MREGGRIVSVVAVIAIAVNSDGQREVLGIDVITIEDDVEAERGALKRTRRQPADEGMVKDRLEGVVY